MNRRGYCIYIDTFFEGSVPSVMESPADADGERVCIFGTERDAQLEIIDYLETRLQEFKDGEREFDDAIAVQEYVVEVEVLPDGKIVNARRCL